MCKIIGDVCKSHTQCPSLNFALVLSRVTGVASHWSVLLLNRMCVFGLLALFVLTDVRLPNLTMCICLLVSPEAPPFCGKQ